MHRFRDIALDESNIAIRLPFLRLTPDGGVPWDDLRKILQGGQRMARVQNGVEILPKILSG